MLYLWALASHITFLRTNVDEAALFAQKGFNPRIGMLGDRYEVHLGFLRTFVGVEWHLSRLNNEDMIRTVKCGFFGN